VYRGKQKPISMIESTIDRIWGQKYTFFGVFFAIFFVSYLVLVAIDFVPEPKQEAKDEINTAVQEKAENKALPVGTLKEPVAPTSIYIKKLDKEVKVLNPESREVAKLDYALLSGVVRHPDSSLMGVNGNMLILGHSSHLPNVINKNFQAFNGIEDLEWGDTIEVRSGDQIVTYQVEKVFKAKASEVTIPTEGSEPRLTLATCNSFGSKDDRFVVEAKAVSTRQLAG
jgi:LPXTG-site transpeptidase (sortase) family protein